METLLSGFLIAILACLGDIFMKTLRSGVNSTLFASLSALELQLLPWGPALVPYVHIPTQLLHACLHPIYSILLQLCFLWVYKTTALTANISSQNRT